jgi:hypothetical protein
MQGGQGPQDEAGQSAFPLDQVDRVTLLGHGPLSEHLSCDDERSPQF